MTKPVSFAVVPAQPSKDFYSTSELALFATYTRESYYAAYGVVAPPFDSSKPIKRWFDSAADASHPENVALYRVIGRKPDGTYGYKQLVLPAVDAGSVNLPGWGPFPTYIVSPTNAKRTGPGNLTPQSLNADYLSSFADAQALMLELGASAVVEEADLGGGFGTYFPSEEGRRFWELVLGGRHFNVGMLLKIRNAQGVGAPGSWDKSGDSPSWVPAPKPVAKDDVTEREMPVRELLANEEIRVTSMGMGILVARTDVATSGPVSGGGFTSQDRVILSEIYYAMFPGKR